MLSSGLEPPLDSSVSAVRAELYAGLPESISTELMALPEPNVGLDAKSGVSMPVLAHSDGLSAGHRRTSGAEIFCQKTEDLGNTLEVVSPVPAESITDALLKAGDLEEDEKNKKRSFRKLDCVSDGYQKEDQEAQDAEEYRAESCALTPGESWSEQNLGRGEKSIVTEHTSQEMPGSGAQKDPHLHQREVKSLRTCCTEIAGSLRNTEEIQANVQVTDETLPKLTEEVQGMKADGTRIFSKAGCRSDRVSKGLPPESNECPDIDTVMARAGVSETSTLDFLEPLKVMDNGSATEHPQETNEYTGSKARTAMLLRAGGNVSVLETRGEKLPRQNPVTEFNTSLANCQTYQQNEEDNAHDFCTGPVPTHNEPHRLSSVESSSTLSTKSSEVLYSVLQSICYVDFRNMSLENNNSTVVHGVINETSKKYLPQTIESQAHDHGTEFTEIQTSTSVPVEQISVIRSKELSSAKIDHKEVSASLAKSYSSEVKEAAEVRRKMAVGDNVEVHSWPEAQEDANSEHYHSSVLCSAASSPEEFSKEKLKMVPSEGDKLKKDQWQFSVSDLCKDDIKENSQSMEMSNFASHEIGPADICFYNTSSKISPPSSHSSLDLNAKLEGDSSEAQWLEKEPEETVGELAGGLLEATEANSNDSLSTGKETDLIYTLNVTLPPVAQKSREPHRNECPPCTVNEVSSRDKAQDNLSGKELISASGTTEEQVTEIVLQKDKFKSSVSSRIFDNPNMTSKISQNMKSSVANTETVVTGLENEHGDTWNCNNQSIKDQSTAASTSCIVSGSACVDDVLQNSHSFNVEVDEKTEENEGLEGETSAGCNSKRASLFPEAHFHLAHGSLPCEDDWGNRDVDLHGINDISTAKDVVCSAYAAEKSVATLIRDEISNNNMDVVKQFDLCEATEGSEIVCDRDEAKGQISMCALQTDEFARLRTMDSPKALEGNQRNKTSEQLLVRYLNKKSLHHLGCCNSSSGPKKRELGTYEKIEVSSLTANSSGHGASICDTCPLLNSMNIQTQRGSQTGKTLHPMDNQCLACQSEFDGPVSGSKKHLETSNIHPNPGLQMTTTSVEETELPIGSSQSEEILLKPGNDLPLFIHKYAGEDSFQRTLKDSVGDLDSLSGVRNEDCSVHMGFVRHLTEENTIKEHKNGCEREDKGTLEESFSGNKSHCLQQACLTKYAKEKGELVFAGNKMQQSLPKMKWLVEDQENQVSAQLLPFSSIHGSLSCKPENTNALSETENKKSLRIKSTLNNSCPQLTFEPGKETVAQKGTGPSHFGKFDIQESVNESQADSETLSALNLGISLPEKEKLCMASKNTQVDNHNLSSAKVFSKDFSVTKPLSVTTSVKRKASNTEIPSPENETATGFVSGAQSSGVCAHSKEVLRNEVHGMLTVKGVDGSSPRSTHCGEKFKKTCAEEKMEGEVASREKLPIYSFLDEEGCLGALLQYSKESGNKIVPLSTEKCGKVLEEIPRSNLNNHSKERKKDKKFTNLAGTSLLSETVRDWQAEDVFDTEPSQELQYNITPTFYPPMSVLPNSCKEPTSNCVVCSEVRVPYKLKAQSKDNVKEIAEGKDAIPTRSVCKENEALGSERLHQVEKCQVLKRKKKHEKMEVHLSAKAQQEQKSKHQEKAKIVLQPSMLHSSEILCSSSDELMTSRSMKFEDPSEIFSFRTSENKVYSTLQEVKRPKITTDIISSQFLKTQDSEMENLNLNLGCDRIPGAFGTTNKPRGSLPLKIQPGRACKKLPTSYQLKTVRKSRKIKSSPFFEIPSETFPKLENTLLKSLLFPCKPPTMEMETAMRFVHMPRQRAKSCSLLNSLKFRKCTKEPALLSKLSAMASKLLAPAKNIHNLEPLLYSSEILPVSERYSQRRSKNLLEAFSCINRNLHSRGADSWCTKMFSFQPLALYPVESTKIPFSDLRHKPPTCFLDTTAFPISFHIKLDSSPVTDLTGITSQHSVHHRPVLGEMTASPAEWTFSFLLSQSCSDAAAFKEDASLNDELHSSLSVTTRKEVALHPDHGRNAIAERRGGCSMLGLHTVLALSSPGCYRIWTRRRNLTSRIPTVQRLFISQFAQGLKGARYPTSISDDLVSSLPYSLGRVLSIWSQHGPSACPSEITPLHSNHCKWQPSVGIENSYAMLPHLPVQSMEALQTAGHEIRLETSFPLLLPKSSSLPELSPSPTRLSVSELQVCALDEADASVPACLRSQDDTELKKTESENRPKKVSQIRIRKTVPKPDPNLTPMGLPKPKRLKKKEFSLEEIYTNKNYKSPPPARSLETIFEEPKEKNGHFISVSQQKRKRILEFQDFTLPRKRKTRGKIKAVGSFTRAKKAALQSAELDALLSQKLTDLEAFFAKEAEQEQASSI